MNRILDPIDVRVISKNEWKLLASFKYHVGDANSEEYIIVPKGFETDFASIPKIFHSLINPVGKVKHAALVHDYLYSLKGGLTPQGFKYDRKRSDDIFLEVMKVVGVSWWKRRTMYRTVRMFGGIAWSRGA